MRCAPAGASTASRGWPTSWATASSPAIGSGCALDWLEDELDRAYRGDAPSTRCCVRLQPTLRECALPREPFVRLIEANRVDQRVSRYETWEQLRGYCELSANPVGELVLGVFGLATPARVALSDAICTALQLAEHCQDVAEDCAAGACTCRPRTSRASAARMRRPAGSRTPVEPSARGCSRSRSRARAGSARGTGAPLIDELHGRASAWRWRRSSPAVAPRWTRSSAPATTCSPGPPRAAHVARALLGAGEHARASDGRAVSVARDVAEAYRALRVAHAQRGGELLLRHSPAPARQAPGDVRGVRVRAARSTTSATDRSTREEKLRLPRREQAPRARALRPTSRHRPGDGGAGRRPRALLRCRPTRWRS